MSSISTPFFHRSRRRGFPWLLWFEQLGLFWIGPLLVVVGIVPTGWKMILLLIAAVLAVAVALVKGATLRDLGMATPRSRGMRPTLRTGLPLLGAFFLVALAVQAIVGDPLLPFPRERPGIFLLVCLLYPLSALAQELIFRSYFFYRYRRLGGPGLLFALNVLAFGWLHIVFGSWLSVWLSALGSVLFTGVYMAYRSLGGVTILHAVAGLMVFAAGFGRHFYSGTQAAAQQIVEARQE